MSDDDFIYNLCKSSLDDLKEKFEQLSSEDGDDDQLRLINGQIQYLQSLYKSFKQNRDRKDALSLIASIASLKEQINVFDISVLSASSSGKTKTNFTQWVSIKSFVKATIKKLSMAVWQLISRLMTLRGWSVSGNANIGFFGFGSGGVKIQLHFD